MTRGPILIQTGDYQLTRPEAYEAFYLLAKVGSESIRRVVLVILIVLGAALTIMYGLRPRRLDFQMMAVLCAITFAMVVIAPNWKARRGANKVAQTGGYYRLGLGQNFIVTPDGERHPLAGDRWAKAFETKDLFVLRPTRTQTFCLPKRLFVFDQIIEIRQILKDGVKNFVQVKAK
jgi:hypothetical protein